TALQDAGYERHNSLNREHDRFERRELRYTRLARAHKHRRFPDAKTSEESSEQELIHAVVNGIAVGVAKEHDDVPIVSTETGSNIGQLASRRPREKVREQPNAHATDHRRFESLLRNKPAANHAIRLPFADWLNDLWQLCGDVLTVTIELAKYIVIHGVSECEIRDQGTDRAPRVDTMTYNGNTEARADRVGVI